MFCEFSQKVYMVEKIVILSVFFVFFSGKKGYNIPYLYEKKSCFGGKTISIEISENNYYKKVFFFKYLFYKNFILLKLSLGMRFYRDFKSVKKVVF